MSANSLVSFDPKDGTLSFGGLSDETLGKVITIGAYSIKSVLDPLHYLYETKKLNKIIELMNSKGLDLAEAVKTDQTGWTLKFTKVVLENAIVEENNNIFEIWRKLIISYNDKNNKFREKCIEYSKILPNLTIEDVKILNDVYSENSLEIIETDYNNFYSYIEKLIDLELISALQYNNGGQMQGKLNINPYKRISVHNNRSLESRQKPYYTYIKLILNHKTKEFVDFMNQNI